MATFHAVIKTTKISDVIFKNYYTKVLVNAEK